MLVILTEYISDTCNFDMHFASALTGRKTSIYLLTCIYSLLLFPIHRDRITASLFQFHCLFFTAGKNHTNVRNFRFLHTHCKQQTVV